MLKKILVTLALLTGMAFGQSGASLAGYAAKNPTGDQNVNQPPGAAAATVNTSMNVNVLNHTVYLRPGDTKYNFTIAPTNPATIAVGSNVVTLATCPAGLMYHQPATNFLGYDFHALWLAGTGTPEPVIITNTTCNWHGGGTGTVTFVAAGTHAAGYTLASATSGLQEAYNDSQFGTANFPYYPANGHLVVTPGRYNLLYHLQIPFYSGLIDFMPGAEVVSFVPDDGYGAIYVGNGLLAGGSICCVGTTINGLHIDSNVNLNQSPALELDGQGTRVYGMQPFYHYDGRPANPSFGSLIYVKNDEAAEIQALDTSLNYSWAHCGTDFCSTAVVGAPPPAYPLFYIHDSNLSAQCKFNGVDNLYGQNTLRISNTIIQGSPQWMVRASGRFQGQQVAQIDNVYGETGNCSNPLGLGQMGFLFTSPGVVSVRGTTGPAAALPTFANSGNPGGTTYFYYIIPWTDSNHFTMPLAAGKVTTDGAGGNVTVKWAQLGANDQYDVLRVPSAFATLQAPWGTGTWWVAGNNTWNGGGQILPASCATQGSYDYKICTFTDNLANTPTSHTVHAHQDQNPFLTNQSGFKYWPAGHVLSGGTLQLNIDTYYETGNVTGNGGAWPMVFAQNCNSNAGGIGVVNYAWPVCTTNPTDTVDNIHTDLRFAPSTNQVPGSGHKAPILFTPSYNGNYTYSELLAADCTTNLGKRQSMANHYYIGTSTLSQADSCDAYWGIDVAPGAQPSVAYGTAATHHWYIAQGPTGTGWKMELSASALTLVNNLPIQSSLYTLPIVSTGSLGLYVPVKLDVANADQVVGTTTTDTGDVVVGVTVNAPGVGAVARVVTSGIVSMVMGTGTCAINDFVLVDTTTAGRVKCSGTASSNAFGRAMSAQGSVGASLDVLVAPSPKGAGGSGTPGGANTQVQFNDSGVFGGNAGFVFDKATGNATITGVMTANSYVSTGTGPWSVEGNYGTLSAPAAGKSKLGFGPSGQLQIAENGAGSFTDISKVGHVHAAADVTSGTFATARVIAAPTNNRCVHVDGSGNITVAAADCLTSLAWSSITDAAGALTLANAGNATTFNQTSAVNWTWANTTAATNVTSQSSPIWNLSGTYWTGAASAVDNWTFQDVVANGTNGTSTLTIAHTGSTGIAKLSLPLLQLADGGVGTAAAAIVGTTNTSVGMFFGNHSGVREVTFQCGANSSCASIGGAVGLTMASDTWIAFTNTGLGSNGALGSTLNLVFAKPASGILTLGDTTSNTAAVMISNSGTKLTGADYTNATTTLTTVVATRTLAASINYAFSCEWVWQGSDTATTLQVGITTPTTPTAINAMVQIYTSAAGANTSGTITASGGTFTGGTAGVATTSYITRITGILENGTNTGALTFQAAANSTKTVTIKRGSYCRVF